MRPDLQRWPGKVAVVAVLALGLGGCALTREPIDTPKLPLPDALPAVEGPTADLPDPWWAIFGDETLDALVREALDYNADLQAAVARVAEARALAGIARADRLPSLDLEAGVTRGRDSQLANLGVPGADETRTDHFVRGVVSYEVDLWGRFAHASTAARARLVATEFDRHALWLSLTGETARAYFDLAAAIGQYEQARATLASREESLPRTISTSRMTFAGLKKCMPTTSEGRPEAAAIASTSRVEVLVASTAPAFASCPSRPNTSRLTARFSNTASSSAAIAFASSPLNSSARASVQESS